MSVCQRLSNDHKVPSLVEIWLVAIDRNGHMDYPYDHHGRAR